MGNGTRFERDQQPVFLAAIALIRSCKVTCVCCARFRVQELAMSDSSSNFRQANGRFAKGHAGGPGRPRASVFRRFRPFSAPAPRRKISWLQRLVRAAVLSLAKNGENG